MQDVTFETEITGNHLLRLPDALPVGAWARVRVEILTSDDREAAKDASGCEIARLDQPARALGVEAPPVSTLGQRLAAIRQLAIERGMVLKSADEILAEVHEGRAEAADDQDLR